MKQILLSYALAALCTGRKTVRVHLRHYALYPHVLGERLVFFESVQKRTFGNLFAHALYFLQLLSAEFYGRSGNLVKVDFTRRNLICGVNYVFCPETGAKPCRTALRGREMCTFRSQALRQSSHRAFLLFPLYAEYCCFAKL